MRQLTLTLFLIALTATLPRETIRGTTVHAWQTAPSSPASAPSADETFDVVSIKRADPDGFRSFNILPGGRLDQRGQTMVNLISRAYGARQVIGGPEWLRNDLYTVQTTASGNPDTARFNAMLRHMLADRLKLVAHMERRDLPVYILTVARADGRLGPNIKPHTPPCVAGTRIAAASLAPDFAREVTSGLDTVPCGGPLRVGGSEMVGVAMTMPMIAQTIQGFWVGDPVRDRTGLTGAYDVRVENIVNQWGNRAPTVDGTPSDAAPLPAALREQLGLRLEQEREPADVVVIDRIERPTEN